MRHWRQLLDHVLREGAWEFARSSGPGGQNVNKTESKAVFRWSLEYSYLTEEEKIYVGMRIGRLLTQAGDLLVGSERFRDREANKKDCVEKVRALFAKEFFVKPTRKKTRPTYSSQKKRLENKRLHSATKQMRRRPNDD